MSTNYSLRNKKRSLFSNADRLVFSFNRVQLVGSDRYSLLIFINDSEGSIYYYHYQNYDLINQKEIICNVPKKFNLEPVEFINQYIRYPILNLEPISIFSNDLPKHLYKKIVGISRNTDSILLDTVVEECIKGILDYLYDK